ERAHRATESENPDEVVATDLRPAILLRDVGLAAVIRCDHDKRFRTGQSEQAPQSAVNRIIGPGNGRSVTPDLVWRDIVELLGLHEFPVLMVNGVGESRVERCEIWVMPANKSDEQVGMNGQLDQALWGVHVEPASSADSLADGFSACAQGARQSHP